MESDGDDLENIFEEYENNENDTGIENIENKSSNETPGAVKVAPPKRIVKNPRLKFNADRLCGERGIPVIVDHFKDVKFKGPGHEKEDLDKLLSKLEHWTHRLFPSMKFEDCLTHIEKLGKKRPVQTCLNKIRLDLPILSSDFVKDNEDDDVRRNDDSEPEEMTAFDRLLEGNEAMSNIDVSTPEIVSDSSSFYSSPMPPVSQSYVLGSSFESSLTEEQKERMERNRMLAAEKRKARLSAMEQNAMRTQSENHEDALKEQNAFNKLLDSSECNTGNANNSNPDSEISHDFEKNSKLSLDCNNENSEKLGLDDLMDLVDEKDPISVENDIVLKSKQMESASDHNNEMPKSPQCDEEENFINLGNFEKNSVDKIISSSEKFPMRNFNAESSLDSVCEVTTDVGCSAKDPSINDENMITLNENLTSTDYVNEIS